MEKSFNVPTFTVGEIEVKVYEFLDLFQEFKGNKNKQSEIWEEHRELLEAYAISDLKLESYYDDLPQPNEDEKMREFNELQSENLELYMKVVSTLEVVPHF